MISENPTPPRRKNKKGKSDGSSSQLLVVGGIVVCLVLGAILMSGGSGGVPELPGPTVNSPVIPAAPVGANVPTAPPTTTLPPRSTPKPAVKPKPTEDPEPTGSSTSTSWNEPKLVTDPAGEPISLLALVKRARDVVAGELQQTPSALIASAQTKMYLPVKLPDDYQLKFTVSRIDGAGSLAIGFMMSGRQGVMVFDADSAAASGLYVDQREPNANCTTRPGKILENKSSAIELTVHPGHVHVTLDGKTVVNWTGNVDRLFVHPRHSLPCLETPFLITGDSKYIIESASMIPIDAQPVQRRPDKLEKDVDVLPMVDLARDIRRGAWTIDKDAGTLRSPAGGSRIYLPTSVPREYTLSFTAEIPSGQDDGTLAVGLVSGSSPFQFTANAKDAAIDMVDGQRFSGNDDTSEASLLKPGTPARIECTVTTEGVHATIDGKTAIDWRGESWRLNAGGEWAMADARRLFLAASSPLNFSDVKLGPPVIPPTPPEESKLTADEPLDLLSVIDPERDAVAGTWERDSTTALKSRGDVTENKLLVPVDFPAEYKLTMKVGRTMGGKANNEGLMVCLPIGNTKLLLAIDGQRSTYTGLHLDNVKLSDSPYARKGQVISATNARELEITVKSTGVKLMSDGKKVFDWTGNPGRATAVPGDAGPPRRMWFGGRDQAFRFEKLRLEQLEPSSFVAPEEVGTDGKLIPIIDVARDARSGEWTFEKGRLASPASGFSRLNIPASVPTQYLLTAKVERKQGSRELYLGLVIDGRPFAIALDGDQMRGAGIDLLDGNRALDPANIVNRRYTTPLLPPNQVIQVKCLVVRDTILVSCGDKEVIRWHGDPRRLSESKDIAPPNYSTADREHLWLGSEGTAFHIRDLQLRVLTDEDADAVSKSFPGVTPNAPQRDLPLATAAQWIAEK